MLRRIDRVILRVEGIESVVRYYRDVLGMKLLRQEKTLASFTLGDGDGTELVFNADPQAAIEEVYFLVDDVRDLYARRQQLRLKFASPPAAVSRGYRAAVRDPFGNVLLLIDRTNEKGATPHVIEGAQSTGTLFAGVEQRVPPKKAALIAAYERIGRTADDLPYTPHFETLYKAYSEQHADPKPTRQETWRHLLNLRKSGKLPKLGESKSVPPPISDESEAVLRNLLGDAMGKRDRLPYSDRFNQLVDEFNKTQARPLSPHFVWRLVARLAK